jgi:hypothetical protein
MIKKPHNILFHTLLLSVYAVFFSVQFFFNFDGPGPTSPQSIFTPAGFAHHGDGTLTAKNGPLHSTTSHKVRLNKRFHQENITPCDVLSVDAPEQYVTRETPGAYRSIDLPFTIPVHRLLRGPPFAA